MQTPRRAADLPHRWPPELPAVSSVGQPPATKGKVLKFEHNWRSIRRLGQKQANKIYEDTRAFQFPGQDVDWRELFEFGLLEY